MFRFEHIYLFAILAVLPVLVILYLGVLRWKSKTIVKLGDARMIRELTRNYSSGRYALKFFIALACVAFLVVAAANPQTKGDGPKINRKGLDLIILMDVSKSMLATDIKPNRLERSKQLVSIMIDQLAENRIGLVWFAGRAYLQMPLTTDVSAAKLYLQNAGPEAVPTQGTVIGEALKMAGNAFNSQEKKYKAVVLISDGEDHDPEALKIVKDLVASGVMINTVGVGSAEGSTIYDPATKDTKRDAAGNTVITKLNEQQLRELAQAGNGTYVYLQDPASAVKSLEAQLSTIDQKALTDDAYVQYNTWFYYILALVFILLLTEIFIPERKPLPA